MFNAKKISEFFKSDKGIKAAVVIGIILICIVFFSNLFTSGADMKSTPITTNSAENPSEYENELERRLLKILSKIEGTGEIEIMLTLESTSEYVFVEQGSEKRTENESRTENGITEASTNIDSQNEYILVEGQSGRKEALLKTVVQPRVRGVTVVCTGGDSVYVREKVVNSVSKLFGISSAKVYVTK